MIGRKQETARAAPGGFVEFFWSVRGPHQEYAAALGETAALSLHHELRFQAPASLVLTWSTSVFTACILRG